MVREFGATSEAGTWFAAARAFRAWPRGCRTRCGWPAACPGAPAPTACRRRSTTWPSARSRPPVTRRCASTAACARRNNTGVSHENGAVVARQGSLKRGLDQGLLAAWQSDACRGSTHQLRRRVLVAAAHQHQGVYGWARTNLPRPCTSGCGTSGWWAPRPPRLSGSRRACTGGQHAALHGFEQFGHRAVAVVEARRLHAMPTIGLAA